MIFSHSDNLKNEASTAKEMEETKERFFVFIGKLEERLKEFAEASIPELVTLNNTDTDEFKREYLRMKSAVLGQLDSMMKKAQDVKEEKITNFSTRTSRSAYLDFRDQCYARFYQLDELCKRYQEKIETTFSEDYEAKYQRILDEYEATINKFRCSQCGSPIAIDKIYFTSTYLTCPACQTQNTFEPSSQAKMLEQIGRSLAEQRTAHLRKAHDEIPEKTQALYLQQHALKQSLYYEKDKSIIKEKTKQLQELENQQKALEKQAPVVYQQYLRAMFDEWNKINPDLREGHERFYNRLLNDYNNNKNHTL